MDEANANANDHEKEAKLRSLERVQWGVQCSTGALGLALLFTYPFLIPMLINSLVVAILLYATVVMDRRIRKLGGKGGSYVGAKR